MKKFFIIFFLVLISLVAVMVYHKEIISALEFVFMRPYRGLSAEDLEMKIGEVDVQLKVINEKLDRLSSSRSLGNVSAARDLRDQSKPILVRREGLFHEKAWREKRIYYYFKAGFVISFLLFLILARRTLYHRDPSTKKREKFRKKMGWDKPGLLIAGSGSASGSRPAKGISLLTTGKSTRQDVINLLGEPSQRTTSLDFETWTYSLPLDKAKSVIPEESIEFELIKEREAKGKGSPSPGSFENALVPVIIHFEGDLLHDLSVGMSNGKTNGGRIL